MYILCFVSRLKQRSRRRKGKQNSRRSRGREKSSSKRRGQGPNLNLLLRGSPSLSLCISTFAGSAEQPMKKGFALSRSQAVHTSTSLRRNPSQRNLNLRSLSRRSRKLQRLRSFRMSLLRSMKHHLKSHQLETTRMLSQLQMM